jgi:hypothetical protein
MAIITRNKLAGIAKQAIMEEIAKIDNQAKGANKILTTNQSNSGKDVRSLESNAEKTQQPNIALKGEKPKTKDVPTLAPAKPNNKYKDVKVKKDNNHITEKINPKSGEYERQGQQNISYDNINDKYQKRVDALIMGKDCPNQKDIDDKSQGVSTTGNKKFIEGAKEVNQWNNDHSTVGGKGLVQFGDHIQLTDEKPKGKSYAVESVSIKKGNVILETKQNVKLQVTKITEERTSLINPDNNQKYSISNKKLVENIKNRKMVLQTEDKKPETKVNEVKTTNENEKVKRLIFKKIRFIDENHILSLIPQHLTESKIVMKDMDGDQFVVENKDGKQTVTEIDTKKSKINEELNQYQHLSNYKPANSALTESERKTNSVDEMRGILNIFKKNEIN